MERTVNSQHKRNLAAMAAALAPVTHAASGTSWPVAAAIAIAAWILGRWCRYGTGWVLTAQKLWGCILISTLMGWSKAYWPGLPFLPAVPLVLLVLAAWTVSVSGKATTVACVLLWPTVILLGAVLLSALPEIKQTHLAPVWEMREPYLLPMLLLPFLENKKEKKILGVSVAVSVLTIGVLSLPICMDVPSGIYELSRSLSLLGMAERFESLIAAGVTMGFYAAIAFLLKPSEGKKAWIYAALAAAIYLIKLPLNGWILSGGSVLLWVIAPIFCTEK